MNFLKVWARKQGLFQTLRIHLGSIICMLCGICEQNLLFIPKMYFHSSVFVCEDNPAKLKQLQPSCHEILGVCVFTYIQVSICVFIYVSVQC